MSVEAPSSPTPRSKGTLVIILSGLALLAFFIVVSSFSSKTGGTSPLKTPAPSKGMPPPEGTPLVVGTQGDALKHNALPQGPLKEAAPFISLQGYKLTIPKGWRVLPLPGAAGTDLILQAPEPHKQASVFTVTVVDDSKRPVKDPLVELPAPGTFNTFTPVSTKRTTLDGAPAATQESTVIVGKVPARVLQVFVGHNQRAYNMVGVCPQSEFVKRRPQIQSMVDSFRWIAPKQPAPTPPTL